MPFTVRSPAASHRVIRHPYLHSCRAASPASLTLVLREVHTVKIQRLGQVAALALVGSIALAGCGSDDNTGSASSSSATGSAASADCFEGTLNAEGSSAQKNAFEEAAASFLEKCPGATMNYNPTGSGAGIKQFIAGQVDFAGSDSALKTEEKDGDRGRHGQDAAGPPAWNLPMVVGPVAIAYNVDGVDKLVLTADGARRDLQRHDQDVERPDHRHAQPGRDPAVDRHQGVLPLRRVGHHRELHEVPHHRRADGAGPTSRPRPGAARARARRSRPASPRRVKATDGAITYVEWSYAKDNEPEHRPDRQRRRRRRADRRARRQGRRRRPRSRATATTCALDSTYADQGGRRLPDRSS